MSSVEAKSRFYLQACPCLDLKEDDDNVSINLLLLRQESLSEEEAKQPVIPHLWTRTVR